MRQRLSTASLSEQKGFTLIELLVVILIIGILAAIAIPSFLNQKGKATDASAKELAHTLQVAAESVGTDNSGSYATVGPYTLAAYETTIQLGSGHGNAYLQTVTGNAGATGTATGYTVTATSANGDTFTITRGSNGAVTRTCTSAAAPATGCTGSSW